MPAKSQDGARESVLLVEDERELAAEIVRELEHVGRRVEWAQTLAAGLAAARRGDAAVLVVDRMLNGEDGLDLIESLRREGNPAPVLVVSAIIVNVRAAGFKLDVGV